MRAKAMAVQSVWLAVVVIIMTIRVMPLMNKLFTMMSQICLKSADVQL